MMRTIKLGLASAAIAFAVSSTAAFATTIAYSTSDIGSVTVPTANSTTGTVFQNITGSSTGLYKNPYQTALGVDTCTTCKYTSVSGGGSASYTSLGSPSALQVMWGSPDPTTTRNLITFFNGINSVFSINGDQVLAANSFLTASAGFITVLLSDLPTFDKVTFSDAADNAFEYAFRVSGRETPNVPLPGGLILLMSGLAGMGYLGRSRAKKA